MPPTKSTKPRKPRKSKKETTKSVLTLDTAKQVEEPQAAPEVHEPVQEQVPSAVETPSVNTVVSETETDSESVVSSMDDRIGSLIDRATVHITELRSYLTELKDIRKVVNKELKKKKKTKRSVNPNRPPSGFAKPAPLSDELCQFMSIPCGTLKARTEVTKFFCNYFKEHNLQNPEYKRTIIPNAAIKSILKLKDGDEVTYFNLQKFLKVHYPASAAAAASTSA